MVDYYFRRNVYYIDIYMESIFDVKNRTRFRFITNEYKNDYFKFWFFTYAEKPITKKEYDNVHKNKLCNCKIGSGKPNIECGSLLNIIDEFNRYNKNDNITIEKDIINGDITYIFKHKNYVGTLTNHGLNYYKKACLKCNTCLTDYESLFIEFDNIIVYFENYEKVNQICDNQ